MISYFKKGIINVKLDDETKTVFEILNGPSETRLFKFSDEVRYNGYNSFLTAQEFQVSSEQEFEEAKQSVLGSL